MSRLFQEDRLVLATHNQGKLEEIAALLTPFDVNVVGAGSLNLPEPEETESSFVGNARIKAHAAAKATGSPALADDSGIEIAALNGAPGVYTADWAETPKGRNFKMAMEKVHFELEKINAPAPRIAQFCCTLVLAWPDGTDAVFEGIMPGQVIWPMRGGHPRIRSSARAESGSGDCRGPSASGGRCCRLGRSGPANRRGRGG